MNRRVILNGTIFILLIILGFLLYVISMDLMGRNQALQNQDMASSVEKDQIKIGLSLGTLKEERWLKDRDILIAKLKELGADVIVQNANNDDQDQIDQVKFLLSQHIDLLILVPNDLVKAAQAVEMAKSEGVKVISYDRLVMNADIDAYLSFDNVKVGELMAEHILRHVESGNLLIMNGAQSDHNTAMIKEGYDRVLAPYVKSGKIRIVREDWAPNWLKEYAFHQMDQFLQEGTVDAVIAGNDGLADGIYQALAEHRLAGKTVLVGQDADLSACQRIVEGTQTMTVYKPIEKLADLTAVMAMKLAREEPLETTVTIHNGKYDIPYFALEPIAVTKENMDETVIKDGFHMRSEIYRDHP